LKAADSVVSEGSSLCPPFPPDARRRQRLEPSLTAKIGVICGLPLIFGFQAKSGARISIDVVEQRCRCLSCPQGLFSNDKTPYLSIAPWPPCEPFPSGGLHSPSPITP